MNYYIIALTAIIILVILMIVIWYCSCDKHDSHEECKPDHHLHKEAHHHQTSQNYAFYKPTEQQRRDLAGMSFIDDESQIKNYKVIFYNSDHQSITNNNSQMFILWDDTIVESLETRIEELKAENKDLVSKIIELEENQQQQEDTARSVRESREAVNKLQKEKENLDRKLRTLESNERSANEQIRSLRSEVKSLEELKQNLLPLQRSLTSFEEEKSELMKEKQELELQIQQYEEHITETLKKLSELQQQLDAKNEDYEEAMRVIETFEKLSSNKIDIVQHVVSLEHMIRENQRSISNMEEIIGALKDELELKNVQAEDLVKTNDSLIDTNNKLVFDIDKWKHHVVAQSKIISQLQSGKVTSQLMEEIRELKLIDEEMKQSIMSEQAQTRGMAKIGHLLKSSVASIYSLAPSSAFGNDDEEKIESLTKQGAKVIIGAKIDESIKDKYKSVRFIDLADPSLYITLFKVIMSISSAVTVIVSTLSEVRKAEKRFYPLNVNAVVLDDQLDVFKVLDKPGVVHFMESAKDKVYNLVKLRGQRIVAHVVDNYVHEIVAEFNDLFPKYTALISNLLYRGSGVKVARSFSGRIELRDMEESNKSIVYLAQPDSSLSLSDIKSFGDRFGINVLTVTLDYSNPDKEFEILHRLYDCGIRVFIGVRSTFEVQYDALAKLQELYSDVVVISEGSNLDMDKQYKIIRLLESDRVITERVRGHLNTIKIRDNDGNEMDSEILFVLTPNDYHNDDMNVVIIDEEEEINIDELAEHMKGYDIVVFNATVSELFYDNIEYFPSDKLYIRYNDSCIHNRLIYKMKDLGIDYNDIAPITKGGKNTQIMEAIMYSSFIMNMTHLPFDKIVEYSVFLRGPHEAIQLNSKGDRIDQSLAIYRIIDDEVKIECVIPKLSYRDDAPACLINL